MEEALELTRKKDTKERMAGVERLHQLLEASRKSLTSSEVTSLIDVCLDLLKDGNFRVSQGALQKLASVAVLSGEHLKLHFNAVVPAVVERLGDAKQPVRDAARRLLLTLMQVSSPTIIVERAGSYAWTHKSWRVREEFARTVTSAITLFASTELPLQRAILPPILLMMDDPHPGVREAAISCIEEMYMQAGPQFSDELQRHHLPTSLLKDITARLEKIEPNIHSPDVTVSNYPTCETKPSSITPKKSTPKAKSPAREVSLCGADGDITEKPVEPIKVYSERDLMKEFEKIASTLMPDKDWSMRIAAMQRVEGLVIGGAADYPCFRGLLKQLVGPLSSQLSDRRSSIVKQACHLLCFLSKELLGDFEACAEMYIPVLFKLVVITVLVIAESADNCIKTMLRNCKVSRVLPRIVDCSKNDRSAVLRARCCEYALLILEYWTNAPEIQRSADLYEDLIRCCVTDAISEVRSTARMCYRIFAKTWPQRSRRLLMSFDPVAQRVINDEEGGVHRRHPSPSHRERSSHKSLSSQTTAPSKISGFGTSAIVPMHKSASLSSGTSLSSGVIFSQAKSAGKGTERGLESVLHATNQKVTAIESMLRGLDISERSLSSSLDLAVEQPSSVALPASNGHANSFTVDTMSGRSKGEIHNGGLSLSDIIAQIQAAKDSGTYDSCMGGEPLSGPSSYSAKRATEKQQERYLVGGKVDFRGARRYMNSHVERQELDTLYKDANHGDSLNGYVPNFQRPLLRNNVAMRMPVDRSFDDSKLAVVDVSSYPNGPSSLNEALSEGLSSSSDWNARVSAFSFVQSLLQQGPRGTQEILQSFEKVIKFFRHLDDPHHKVAQAALSALSHLIPACRKPFESYMERILPHVFSRLIDPKELVRQSCSTTLEIVGKTYSTDSLLPALLRSLDEQRSPKAKLAVIEFANNSFKKHKSNSEGSANSGILKLWLAKLKPLVRDKNMKLKEAAITSVISVYNYFDSLAVLNFILGLSVEEQNSLRRALKHYTPRIEIDLMNFMQSKKERRSKSSCDQSDMIGSNSEEGFFEASNKNHLFGTNSAVSGNRDDDREWNSPQVQDASHISSSTNHLKLDEAKAKSYHTEETGLKPDSLTSDFKNLKYASDTNHSKPDEAKAKLYHIKETGFEPNNLISDFKNQKYALDMTADDMGSLANHLESMESHKSHDVSSTPHSDISGVGCDHPPIAVDFWVDNELSPELTFDCTQLPSLKIDSIPEARPSIPLILHFICNENGESSTAKRSGALQQLVEASVSNDQSIWSQYFNRVLTTILEVLDDSDSSICEQALSLVVEMLKNQKEAMEDYIEILIEKLLHAIQDSVPKVSNEVQHCLTIVLSQYDPFRCLSVIVPLLASEDESTLITCVNCLIKLMDRLSHEELMAQLPSFLPAVFYAFENQSADVRKVWKIFNSESDTWPLQRLSYLGRRNPCRMIYIALTDTKSEYRAWKEMNHVIQLSNLFTTDLKTIVLCLVDIYIKLGKAFLPYLEGLNATQLRLVTIYTNRISQARAGTSVVAT